MKALMYHYVRPAPADLPYFRYLHIDSFRRQLDWIEATHGFVSRDRFLDALHTGTPANGVVLTFDDAFSDHFLHVFHELSSRGLWGIFYVPTAILRSDRLLDVHRIHLIVGRAGGTEALKAALRHVDESMISHGTVDAFRRLTYTRQDNDADTNAFKRLMNYFISYDFRSGVLERLMRELYCDEAAMRRSFYVGRDDLREMHAGGMIVGGHGVNHLLMSKLSDAEQAEEIDRSLAELGDVLGERVETFCYPYGGFHSFNATTERLLKEAGVRFSFNVEARDITRADLTGRPQALPRWDCNAFPHGRAHFGPMPPPLPAADRAGSPLLPEVAPA